jgi:hypothetical protein
VKRRRDNEGGWGEIGDRGGGRDDDRRFGFAIGGRITSRG